jgi:hypothetical protein
MFHLVCFILLEAIAASAVCHQRSAIFGRGVCIFVLTHFPCPQRQKDVGGDYVLIAVRFGGTSYCRPVRAAHKS